MGTNGKLLAEWFWTDRWTGSRGFLLPMEARGLYREMLTQAWKRGGKLPKNFEEIRRIVGATRPEWKRGWPRVSTFWRVDGEYLVNDTQIEIYRASQARNLSAVKRGRMGAETRWGKAKVG